MNDLLDYSEATSKAYALHKDLLQALLDKKWDSAASLSKLISEEHRKLQEWLANR